VSIQRTLAHRTTARALRVRAKFAEHLRPRLSVFRSSKHIYAQIIDDLEGKTLLSCSSMVLEAVKGDKKTVAAAVGKKLAALAQSKGIKQVAFDRGSFLYHGRVKALAEAAREAGLEF